MMRMVRQRSAAAKVQLVCMVASAVFGVVVAGGGLVYETGSAIIDSIAHRIEVKVLEKVCGDAAELASSELGETICNPTKSIGERFNSWVKQKFQDLKSRLTGDKVQVDDDWNGEADQAASQDAEDLSQSSNSPPSTEVVDEEVAEGDTAEVDQTETPAQLEVQAADTNPADQAQAQQAQAELQEELQPEAGQTMDTAIADPVADAEMADGAAAVADASSAETASVLDSPETAASASELASEGTSLVDIASNVGSVVFSETNILAGTAYAIWEIGQGAIQDLDEWSSGPMGWDPSEGENGNPFRALGGTLDSLLGKSNGQTDTANAISACTAATPYLANYLSAFNMPGSLIAEAIFWDWNPADNIYSGSSVPNLYDFGVLYTDYVSRYDTYGPPASGCPVTAAQVNAAFTSAESQSLYSLLHDPQSVTWSQLMWLSQVSWSTLMPQAQDDGSNNSLPVSALHDDGGGTPGLSWSSIGTLSGTGAVDASCGGTSPSSNCGVSYTDVQSNIQSTESSLSSLESSSGSKSARAKIDIAADQATITQDEAWLGDAFPDGADLVATVLNSHGAAYTQLVSDLKAGNQQEYLSLETLASQASHPASASALRADLKDALDASGMSASNLPPSQTDGSPGVLGSASQEASDAITLGSNPSDPSMPDTTTEAMVMALIDYEGGAATCTSTDCTQTMGYAPVGTEGNVGDTGMLPTQYAKYIGETGACTSSCTASDGEENQITAAGMALAAYLKQDNGSVVGAFADYVRDNRLPAMDGAFGSSQGPLEDGWGSLAVAQDGSPSSLPTAVLLAEMASQYQTYLDNQSTSSPSPDASVANASVSSPTATPSGDTTLTADFASPGAFEGYALVEPEFVPGIESAAAQAQVSPTELYAIANSDQIYGSDGLSTADGVVASSFGSTAEVVEPNGSPSALPGVADIPQFGDVSSGLNPAEQCNQAEVYPLSDSPNPSSDQGFVHPTETETFGMFQLTVQEFQEFGAQAGLSPATLGTDGAHSQVAPSLGYCPDLGEPEAMMDPVIEAQAAAFLLRDLQQGTDLDGNSPNLGDQKALDGALEAYLTRNWMCPGQDGSSDYAASCPVATLRGQGLLTWDNPGAEAVFKGTQSKISDQINNVNSGSPETPQSVGDDWNWADSNGNFSASQLVLLQAWVQLAPEVATATYGTTGSISAYASWVAGGHPYDNPGAVATSVPCTGSGCPPAGQFWQPGMTNYQVDVNDLAAARGAFPGYLPLNVVPASALVSSLVAQGDSPDQCTVWAMLNSLPGNDVGGNGWEVALHGPGAVTVAGDPTEMPPVGAIVSFMGEPGADTVTPGHVAVVVYDGPTWYEISEMNTDHNLDNPALGLYTVDYRQIPFAAQVTSTLDGIPLDDSLDAFVVQALQNQSVPQAGP